MGLTPWDLGGAVTPPLIDALDHIRKQKTNEQQLKWNACIPGCGSGCDSVYLTSQPEIIEVVGIDLSSVAIKRANEFSNGKVKPNKKLHFICADFFDWDGQIQPNKHKVKFNIIFDYLFFSAIEPSTRFIWAKKIASIMNSNDGWLITIIFPLATPQSDSFIGPPYHVSLKDYHYVLDPLGFELVMATEVHFHIIQ
jgi:hypothetical protein